MAEIFTDTIGLEWIIVNGEAFYPADMYTVEQAVMDYQNRKATA